MHCVDIERALVVVLERSKLVMQLCICDIDFDNLPGVL